MENAKTITLPSPAKINHFLQIIGRRVDGYHQLQTLYQFLDYSENWHFEHRSDQQIILQTNLGIPNHHNLIYQAALALQQTAKVKQGVTIRGEKILPIGGGLGGGSSNAATTLCALNHLWQLHWSRQKLMKLGASLGADIPFFIYGKAAWGEGIGERLTFIELNEPWVIVITPPCQVLTKKMFADPDLTRSTPSFKIDAVTKGDFGNLKNDFEPIVRRHYPDVDKAMYWLSNFGKARLSGSGASVFACFALKTQAEEVIRQLPPSLTGFIAKGLNQSPLLQASEKLGCKY